MVTLARRAQRTPFAPVVAILFGAAAAILVAELPQWLFEQAVVASGLPTLLAAAAPPLGLVARILAVALAFAGVALLLWLLLSAMTRLLAANARARTPWRDEGYDGETRFPRDELAPARRPIFAPDELGAPLMSDEAIGQTFGTPRAPADDAPSSPTVDPSPEPGFKTPVIADRTDDNTSIAALIRRLEHGLARRAAATSDPDPDPDGSSVTPASRSSSWMVGGAEPVAPMPGNEDTIRQALGTLRRMARG